MVYALLVLCRVSKFVVGNVFNNSHIEYNNECDNNNNINDNEILRKNIFSSQKYFLGSVLPRFICEGHNFFAFSWPEG